MGEFSEMGEMGEELVTVYYIEHGCWNIQEGVTTHPGFPRTGHFMYMLSWHDDPFTLASMPVV